MLRYNAAAMGDKSAIKEKAVPSHKRTLWVSLKFRGAREFAPIHLRIFWVMKRLLLLVLILPLGYCTVVTNLAQSKAEAICSAIPESATISLAGTIISKAGIPELKRNDPMTHEMMRKPYWIQDEDVVVAVFPSILGERWVCRVRFSQGQVSAKEMQLID